MLKFKIVLNALKNLLISMAQSALNAHKIPITILQVLNASNAVKIDYTIVPLNNVNANQILFGTTSHV